MKRYGVFLIIAVSLALTACRLLPGHSTAQETDVVFALGTREGFSSPLQAALKPAGPALEFEGSSFVLTGVHRKMLDALIADWSREKPRYLLAGYTPPGLPDDYARSLSERRAQAVRQYLIENKIEAAYLQTVGFGFDSSLNSPSSSVVVIFRQ